MVRRAPEPQLALVLAERSRRSAQANEGRSWGRAIGLYRDAAAYASIALEGPGVIGQRAQEAHNAAVERLIELAQKSSIVAKSACRTDWLVTLQHLGIATAGTTRLLAPDRVGRLIPAEEYHVSGLSHHYGSDGLGVPVVALWPTDCDRNARPPRIATSPRMWRRPRRPCSWPASRGQAGPGMGDL